MLFCRALPTFLTALKIRFQPGGTGEREGGGAIRCSMAERFETSVYGKKIMDIDTVDKFTRFWIKEDKGS
jgi:hypothetical protein